MNEVKQKREREMARASLAQARALLSGEKTLVDVGGTAQRMRWKSFGENTLYIQSHTGHRVSKAKVRDVYVYTAWSPEKQILGIFRATSDKDCDREAARQRAIDCCNDHYYK